MYGFIGEVTYVGNEYKTIPGKTKACMENVTDPLGKSRFLRHQVISFAGPAWYLLLRVAVFPPG